MTPILYSANSLGARLKTLARSKFCVRLHLYYNGSCYNDRSAHPILVVALLCTIVYSEALCAVYL